MNKKAKTILKFLLWILIVQFILINVSAAFHAYKYTHFYDLPAPRAAKKNIFTKTWRIFSGPVIYKEPSGQPWDGFEQYTIPTKTGINMDAWYQANDTARPCVILFHGVTSNKAYFINETSHFSNWGYNLLLVDFRGHGNTEGNNTSFGVKETEEVQAAFDWAKKKGHKKIILYGSSMGAAIVIKAVGENVVSPDGIITDMPFGSLHDHFKSRVKTIGFPSEPFASLITFWVGMERGYFGFNYDVAAYAKNIHCPVLVEWGDKDFLVKQHEILSIYRNIPSKNKKLYVYEGADHHTYLYSHPLQWEKNIKEFVDSL